MYHMILLVLDDINQCTTILEAWEAQGVGGGWKVLMPAAKPMFPMRLLL